MYKSINELLLNDELYNDVAIIVNSKKHNLHKKILSDRSEFLKMLFSKEDKYEYNIDFINNNETFEIIIKIIYGIKISSLEFEIYTDVLNCLDYLLMIPIDVPLITNNKKFVFEIRKHNYDSAIYLNNNFLLTNNKTNEINLNKPYLDKIKEYIESYGVYVNENFNIIVGFVKTIGRTNCKL